MARLSDFPARLGLLTMLAAGGLIGLAHAADLRGKISKVEANGQVRIDLPPGAVARPGDEVRIETTVPGIGPVEFKTHWRVKLVGEGFVIADPEGQASGTPQVGYAAIVTTAAPAAPGTAATQAAVVPSLQLTAEQLAEFQRKANAGETPAMVMLGIYHAGHASPSDTVARNSDQALGWYEKAAQAGDADAMLALGFFYRSQRKDDGKAAEWFRKAADKGNTIAMMALSRCYAEGRGVAKAAGQSFAWLKKAAELGDSLAAAELAQRYLTGEGTRQDSVEAAHWFGKAADQGVVPAMVQLAEIYTNGIGVAQDRKRAFEWSMKAAQAGSSLAMYQVGTYYLHANGTPANSAEAKRWFEQAAQAGEAEAMFGLSAIYATGDGAAADPRAAAGWMIKAIEAGSYQVAENLMKTPGKWNEAFRRELQKGLQQAGVYKGDVSGKLDLPTRRAIAALGGRALKQ